MEHLGDVGPSQRRFAALPNAATVFAENPTIKRPMAKATADTSAREARIGTPDPSAIHGCTVAVGVTAKCLFPEPKHQR